MVVPLFVDEESRPDFAWMDAATRDVARGLQARNARLLRDNPTGGYHPRPLRADALRRARGWWPGRASTSCSPPSGS